MIPKIALSDTVPPSTADYLETLKKSGFRGDIETSYGARLCAATDNSVYQVLPQAVIFPMNHKDVVLVAEIASKIDFESIQLSARGGGTGTNGQSLTPGIVCDLSRYLTEVLEINPEEGWVRVQTGVIKDQLNDALRPHGFFFSPDLSTSNRATIGGMINTDASGQGSLKYGKTSGHVLALRGVFASGETFNVYPVTVDDAIDMSTRADTLAGTYRQVLETCRVYRDLIDSRFPDLNRFLTGYDLKNVYSHEKDIVDLTRILCGSEGSLAILTEAKLNITPLPKFRTLVNVKYNSFEAALRNAPFLVAAKALSVETIDSRVLNLAKTDIIWHSVKELLEEVPGQEMLGINIVEYAGDTEEEQQQHTVDLTQRLDELIAEDKAGVIGYQVTSDLQSITRIYGMRKKAVGLLGNTSGPKKPIAFAEDTCVPPENLADYIMEFRQLLDSHNLK
jgi:FAD/FMN-containing dehydrogenase